MFKFGKRLAHSVYLPLVWSIFTQTLLSLPGSVIPGEKMFIFKMPYIDKAIHLVLFLGLALIWGIYLITVKKLKKCLVILAFLITIYGILVEVIQHYFIPGRTFDIFDIVANGVGVLTGSFLLYKKNLSKNKEAAIKM